MCVYGTSYIYGMTLCDRIYTQYAKKDGFRRHVLDLPADVFFVHLHTLPMNTCNNMWSFTALSVQLGRHVHCAERCYLFALCVIHEY